MTAQLNSVLTTWWEARNQVIVPATGCSSGNNAGRPAPTHVEKVGDAVWVAEKFQSNMERAGSPRRSCRADLECRRLWGIARVGLESLIVFPKSVELIKQSTEP